MGAAAVVGGMVVAAGVGAYAASASADAQENAAQQAASASMLSANYASDLQNQQYQQTRKDLAPWRNAGTSAINQLSAGTQNGGVFMRPFTMADYQADPGYAFRLSEGIKALNNQASARGNLLSGSQLKAAQRYGQDYASNEYQNAFNRYNQNQANQFNRLSSVAGLGQSANAQTQQAGQNYANNASNIAMTNGANQANSALMVGQARASAYEGYGKAASGFANALGSYYGSNSYSSPMVDTSSGSWSWT